MTIKRTAVDLVRSAARGLGLERPYPKTLAVAGANQVTLDFLRANRCTNIAEIGAYLGDTSLEFARYLNGAGELHIFDRDEYVEHTLRRLADAGYTNVRGFTSSARFLDSYNWHLGKLLEQHKRPIYDYVFLDGAHTWAIDALAALLADRLLKVGGFLDFDDYHWTLASSPCLNPQTFPLTARLYTVEQMEAFQVQMIVNTLFRPDRRYREVVPDKIFQKVAE